jgi:hypothetical protein
MIDVAMKFLRDYINQELSPDNDAVLANITKADDITMDCINLSLIQIEEERVLKEVQHRKRLLLTDDFYTVLNPEIRLNLYILITYQYAHKNYEEALKQLSSVVTLFQGKYYFTKPDFIKPAYEVLEQISLELFTQTLDQNNNMWQALGEKLSPSLLYKLRVVGIQANNKLDSVGQITAIDLNVVHKS